VQNDFCSGGALEVPGGDQVVSVLNRYIDRFKQAGWPIFFTRDWHPEKTRHFVAFGGQWPSHCVQGTGGAEFHPDLNFPEGAVIISAGTGPDEEGYSGFDGKDSNGVGLADLVRRQGVHRLFVGGLATDYCVKHTVLDGLREGFEVIFLGDASRGVDLQPGDSERAVQNMVRAGAKIASADDSFF
ncbi:MAG: isochorismatase family protein, partial [Candidatus Binatia bacterium]